jgi:integral membrane sensor domain MASE1
MQSRAFSGLPIIGLLTLVYFIAGKFGLMLASFARECIAVWPPAGIALAALLVLGKNCDGGGACFTVRLPQGKEDNSQAA